VGNGESKRQSEGMIVSIFFEGVTKTSRFYRHLLTIFNKLKQSCLKMLSKLSGHNLEKRFAETAKPLPQGGVNYSASTALSVWKASLGTQIQPSAESIEASGAANVPGEKVKA
jgi:hypothetical protein